MLNVVDAQLRLQFRVLGRDVMLPSVMASDPAHDPNALPVEALKKPHVQVLSIQSLQPSIASHTKAARARAERLVSNLLRLKRNAPRPENTSTSSLLQLRECYPR